MQSDPSTSCNHSIFFLLTTGRKSQLAIEYSYRIRGESPATWVFWIHSSNETRFVQSLRDIADQLKIPGHLDPKVNILKLVESWLQDEKKGKWVCILDNADNHEFLCSLPAAGQGALVKPILEYIPKSRNGSLIITSRSREAALKIVAYRDLIEVKPMEQSEALQLLQKRLEQPGEDQDRRKLVEKLEYIPLAIAQAASYIRNRYPRYSVSQYLREFQASDREAIRLLKRETVCLDRDWEAKNSILVTWQISFNDIRCKMASAAEILALMSFFDRQGIPENLIRLHFEASCASTSELHDGSTDGEKSESDIGPDFEDNITMLRNYSLISTGDTGSSFTMHRLVQLTTRAWLRSNKQLEHWRREFISILYQELLSGEYKDWQACRSIFPHIGSAISQQPKSENSLLQWATLLYKGARYAWGSGNFIDMKDMALKSWIQRTKLLGTEDSDALASTAILAKAYSLEGQWKDAEHLFTQVWATRKTKLGVDHPDTLISMANLAVTWKSQGRLEEAEQLDVRTIQLSKVELGEDHSTTLLCMAGLASTYACQGRWEKAEKLFTHVIETRIKNIGMYHPDTLTSMANLATMYSKQHRWECAERLNIQVLGIRKTKLGPEHPDTLGTIANLASTLWNQERWEEAEQLYMEVIEKRKRKIGMDHPDTLVSMVDIAWTWKSLGKNIEAIELLCHCLSKQKPILGPDHRQTWITEESLRQFEVDELRLKTHFTMES